MDKAAAFKEGDASDRIARKRRYPFLWPPNNHRQHCRANEQQHRPRPIKLIRQQNGTAQRSQVGNQTVPELSVVSDPHCRAFPRSSFSTWASVKLMPGWVSLRRDRRNLKLLTWRSTLSTFMTRASTS